MQPWRAISVGVARISGFARRSSAQPRRRPMANLSRRVFLKASAGAGASFVLGGYLTGCKSTQVVEPTPAPAATAPGARSTPATIATALVAQPTVAPAATAL